MAILTSNPRLREFVLSEASGERSRENIVVTQSGTEIKSGTLLTRASLGAATAEAVAGNTGDPTFGAITAAVPAKAGVYVLTFTAATEFTVEDPDGVTVGSGDTGVAFAKGGLGFTLTAGSTPAVAGDSFEITVADGTGKYVPYTADGAAGPAAGILYNWLPAATGDIEAVGFVRDCEVMRSALTGLDAAGEADLVGKGVIVRGSTGLLSTEN